MIKVLRNVFSLLNRKEKIQVWISASTRMALVTLDLIGVFLVGVVVSLVSGTVIAPTSPLAKLLDLINSFGFVNAYAVIATAAIMFFIIKGVLSVLVNVLTSKFVAKIESDKAAELFQRILDGDLGQIEKFGRHDYLAGLTSAVTAAFAKTITIFSSLLGEIGLLLGISLYLAITNLYLFVMVSVFFALVGIFMQYSVGKVAGRASAKAHAANLKSQEIALATLDSYKQITVSGEEMQFFRKFATQRKISSDENAVYTAAIALPRYITEIAVMLAVGLLIISRSLDSSSAISPTTIAIFLAGMFRIVASMLPLQAGVNQIKEITHQAALAFEFMETFPDRTLERIDSPNCAPSDRLGNDIHLDGVTFQFPGSSRAVLSNVSLEIPFGAQIAVVGKSGEGKSTLADLILGLREPTVGKIIIGSQSPREFRISEPGYLGYVPQSVRLIPGTLLENITFNLDGEAVRDVDLKLAVEVAQLTDLIASLPTGLETYLGPGGADVSGGQAQRIGLARALYGRPRILVLDEATSALDAETERAFQLAFEQLRGELTCIVIAHKHETILNSGLIVEVKSGRLREFSDYAAWQQSK